MVSENSLELDRAAITATPSAPLKQIKQVEYRLGISISQTVSIMNSERGSLEATNINLL